MYGARLAGSVCPVCRGGSVASWLVVHSVPQLPVTRAASAHLPPASSAACSLTTRTHAPAAGHPIWRRFFPAEDVEEAERELEGTAGSQQFQIADSKDDLKTNPSPSSGSASDDGQQAPAR